MDEKEITRFSDQIWVTRVSRVNAEKRLLRDESIVQTANIYYSIITLLASVYLLKTNNNKAGFFIVGMSIALTIISLYFKNLNFTSRAISFRDNYTELQKIEFKLKDKAKTKQDYTELNDEYCDLLKKGENHITFDYYKAVYYSNQDYKDVHLTRKIKLGYLLGVLWRIVFIALVFSLPVCVLIVLLQGD